MNAKRNNDGRVHKKATQRVQKKTIPETSVDLTSQ